MADRYADFAELARHERAGADYRVRLRSAGTTFAIVAPHGGGIEPGTSELAEAVAGDLLSFYAFEGLKRSGNAVLHITSTRFDEPLCLALLQRCDTVVTLHGGRGAAGVEALVGGLDEALGDALRRALERRGFSASRAVGQHAGLQPENLCNRGRSGRGVQLELSRALRESAFASFSAAEGRKQRTARFHDLVQAIVGALAGSAR